MTAHSHFTWNCLDKMKFRMKAIPQKSKVSYRSVGVRTWSARDVLEGISKVLRAFLDAKNKGYFSHATVELSVRGRFANYRPHALRD